MSDVLDAAPPKTAEEIKQEQWSAKVTVDYDVLNSIVMHFTAKNSPKRHEVQEAVLHGLVTPLNYWLAAYSMDTAIRAAHFLAQSCCETFQFSALTETPKKGGREYEVGTKKGKNLGNKSPGDGPLFIGRGLLHLTGRANYFEIGKRIGVSLLDAPGSVSSDLDLAVHTACEFWLLKGLNEYADSDDFDTITHKINGGTNGLDERRAALGRAKRQLGIQ